MREDPMPNYMYPWKARQRALAWCRLTVNYRVLPTCMQSQSDMQYVVTRQVPPPSTLVTTVIAAADDAVSRGRQSCRSQGRCTSALQHTPGPCATSWNKTSRAALLLLFIPEPGTARQIASLARHHRYGRGWQARCLS